MQYPQNLYDGYVIIRDQFQHKPFDTKAIESLRDGLERAIPHRKHELYPAYKIMKELYRVNRKYVLNMVRDGLEPFILWCSARDIIEHYNLDGRVHLVWNKEIDDIPEHYTVAPWVNPRRGPVVSGWVEDPQGFVSGGKRRDRNRNRRPARAEPDSEPKPEPEPVILHESPPPMTLSEIDMRMMEIAAKRGGWADAEAVESKKD